MTKYKSKKKPFTKILYFLGPSSERTKDMEDYRKIILIHAFSIIGVFSLTFFGVWRILTGNYGLAALDFGYAFSLFITHIMAKKTTRLDLICWTGIIQFGAFLVAIFLLEVDGGSSYVWLFLFPPVALYLLGYKNGLLAAWAFIIIFSIPFFLSQDLLVYKTFGHSFPVKLALAMITITIVSFSFEYSRHKANKNMRLAQFEAEEASRLKSQFLANISHEVRTPMNGIIGLLDILSRTNLDEEQSGYLELLKDTSRQSLSILNELLDLSKAESGKLDLHLKPENLLRMTKELVAAYKPKAESKGLVLELATPESLPPVMVDSKRILQVLHNFMNNAFKFTEHGSIKLAMEKTDSSSEGHLKIKFSVKDTGVGVPQDQAKSIFEAFVQADGSYTRQHTGTGLGLAISKKIVQFMRGQIGYSPGDDGGSIFWFTAELPVADEESTFSGPRDLFAKANSSENKDTSKPAGKILLVEDNPVNRLVTRTMLSRLGFEVLLAEDGSKALDVYTKHEVDAILMDVQMPEMDGYQATAQIRKIENEGKRVPIIALTAHAMPEDRKLCLENNMDDYLSKPFSEDSLMRVLLRHLPAPNDTATNATS